MLGKFRPTRLAPLGDHALSFDVDGVRLAPEPIPRVQCVRVPKLVVTALDLALPQEACERGTFRGLDILDLGPLFGVGGLLG